MHHLLVVPVLPSLMDRLGDSKDQVREQDQALLLKIMDQSANPQVGSDPVLVPGPDQRRCLNLLCVRSMCGSA